MFFAGHVANQLGVQHAHVALRVPPASSSSPWMTYPHMQMILSAIANLQVNPLLAGTVTFGYYTDMNSTPAGDPNHIAVALSQVLKLDRHRKDAAKLATSGAVEQHLFMWVDGTRLDVARALDSGVPTQAPEVAQSITTVWLAFPGEHEIELLRWSAARGWRHELVDD